MQRDSLAEIMEQYHQILFRDGVIGGMTSSPWGTVLWLTLVVGISGLGTPAGAYGIVRIHPPFLRLNCPQVASQERDLLSQS